MIYQDAINLLINGHYVTREAWEETNSGCYLVHLPGITHLLKVTVQPKPEVIPWAANIEDSSAADWKTVLREFAGKKCEIEKVEDVLIN